MGVGAGIPEPRPSPAPGMQGVMISTFLSSKEIPLRAEEVGGQSLLDACLLLFIQAYHSLCRPLQERLKYLMTGPSAPHPSQPPPPPRRDTASPGALSQVCDGVLILSRGGSQVSPLGPTLLFSESLCLCLVAISREGRRRPQRQASLQSWAFFGGLASITGPVA